MRLMKEDSYISHSRNFSQDFFDLGVLLIKCIFNDFLSSFLDFENANNFDELYQENSVKSKNSEFFENALFMEKRQKDSLTGFLKRLNGNKTKCCLLHELTSFSKKETKEKQKIEKFKEFFHHIITIKYSENFQSFLCLLLSFNSVSRLTIDSVLNHPFLSKNSTPLVSLNNLQISLSDSVNLHLESLVCSESNNSLIYFEKVLLGLSVALEDSESLVSFDDSELASRKKPKGKGRNITKNSPEIKKLAHEFQIGENFIFKKLKDVYC